MVEKVKSTGLFYDLRDAIKLLEAMLEAQKLGLEPAQVRLIFHQIKAERTKQIAPQQKPQPTQKAPRRRSGMSAANKKKREAIVRTGIKAKKSNDEIKAAVAKAGLSLSGVHFMLKKPRKG